MIDHLSLARFALLSNLVLERVKEARSPFTKAFTHGKKSTMTMSGGSQVTQNSNPLHPQPAREFCTPSSGLFSVGFVFTSYYNRCHIQLFFGQTLFGTALTLSDGMLTPAVSVTSAVAGIGLSVPSLNNNISSISIGDRKSTRLNSSHLRTSRMPSSA